VFEAMELCRPSDAGEYERMVKTTSPWRPPQATAPHLTSPRFVQGAFCAASEFVARYKGTDRKSARLPCTAETSFSRGGDSRHELKPNPQRAHIPDSLTSTACLFHFACECIGDEVNHVLPRDHASSWFGARPSRKISSKGAVVFTRKEK
jgi:hypothetical protein